MSRIRTSLQGYAAAQHARKTSRSSVREIRRAMADAVTPETRHELIVLDATRS